jgi:hypothetical protein
MFPAVIFLVSAILFTTAFFVRRLIDPACPSCARQQWANTAPVLSCRACGWSTQPVQSQNESPVA